MHLKTLEMTGFKSFGKKAILEFTSPISAIVGPNGSGKSNIAEAFRFVLGEQSIKSLRGKRGEDLIFNGGKALPRMNRGAVKAVFDNKQRILNIDFDEVSIERIVNRDGTNEYKINDSDVRLKDIVELLSSAHIGSSGHHIISQGEADRILNASIIERKSILEEALGLKTYQYKKEEGERKLEKTELNMKETESLVRELAPHLRFLKRQYEKIEKAASIRTELLELSKTYLRTETEYGAKRSADIASKKETGERSLDELRSNKTSLEKDFEAGERDKKGTERLASIEKDMQEIGRDIEEKTREMGKIEGEIAYIARRAKKFEEDEAANRDIRISLKDIEHLREKVFETATLEEAKKLLDQFISKYKDAHDVHEELVSLKEELAKLEKTKYGHVSELNSLKKREEVLGLSANEERKKLEESGKQTLERERALMHIESELREKEEDVKRIEDESSVFEEEKTMLKADLQELTLLLGRDVLGFEELTVSIEDVQDRAAQHERKRTMERLKIRLEEAGIANAPEVMKEYKETEERDAFLKKELADLESSKAALLKMIEELEEKIDIEFKSGIKKINTEFNELFRLMFGGGKAELEVVREKIRKRKSDDELGEEIPDEEQEIEEGQEGIDISVELPHKKTKGLVMLSGGERALTSIALLFAMSQVNPPPFIILDETDAALDEANSRKYGDMIEKLSSHSELILITHNRETMSRAGIIYGVTMAAEGTSKLLSIKFDEAVAVAK